MPNTASENEKLQEETQGFFARIDDKYLRPFLIYKYHKVKKQPKYEMEDILAEYNMIQQELFSDVDTEDGDEDEQEKKKAAL